MDSQAVLVLRKPDVLATISDRGGLAEQSGKELQQTVDRAVSDGLIDRKVLAVERLVAALAGKNWTGPVSVRIANNAPRVEGSETITMRRDGEAWAAVVDLDLKVSGGVLDLLRFDLPPQLNSPILTEPVIPQEFVEATGEDRRQLVLRPAEPIAGGQHIRLTIPVPASGGQRVRVPDVHPMNLGQLHRFVRLPTNANEQQLAWKHRGLNFEPLPGRFAVNSPTTEIYRIGDVIGESFTATLKSIEKGTTGPRVRLADIRIVSRDGNSGYGTAAFDLDPAGATTCVLDVPPEFRLVDVQLNDDPAIIRQMAPNQWSVALAPQSCRRGWRLCSKSILRAIVRRASRRFAPPR